MELSLIWAIASILVYSACKVCGRSQDQCEVKLLTKDSTVSVPFGGHFTVNCSYTCDKPVLKTRLLKSNETNGPNWVSYRVLVDDWEKSGAACIHTDYDGEIKISNITIMAYALPSNVTIDLQRELEEGTAHSITCTAYDVAPVSFLTISVTRGGDEIYSKAIDGDLTKGPTTVTEIYNFTASRSDNQKDFTCQATLQLGTVPNTTVQSPSINVRIIKESGPNSSGNNRGEQMDPIFTKILAVLITSSLFYYVY
ncbi:intercellular adhesion molecule 4-like isoform X2 [Pseudophryne corroboree]|uniref:intercellular adhesion molecule 4-like isoform X2 n=1 Tax=Pseudophryne corroboree TaxID=495146 RepID=UPI003081AA71